MKKILFVLLALLPLTVFSQSITVVQPNGGEILYVCQPYTVTWTTSGSVSGYYDIDYSLDGGTIWASITTNYLSPSKTYVWTVPNVQASTVLIRVKDSQTGVIVDQSNAYFTINIPITVTAPNGGETFTPLNNTTITWNAQGTSNSYNLAYSINGGSTWIGIANNYSTTGSSYVWNVPNNPSTNCVVRVQDAVSNCMVDQSNGSFTITPLTPLMTYPNGGEQLNVGQTVNITWDANTFYNTVRLEYSLNNGTTWTTIASASTNDGTESWTIPYLPTNQAYTQCLVRVSNSSNAALNDVSNVTFTIRKPFTLNTPNGGETWTGCNTYAINSTVNTVGLNNWSIFYSLNNGSSWSSIATNISSPSAYNWTIPNTLNGTQSRIRVVNNSYPQYSDTSNAVFTLSPSHDITVTSPNGGQTFTPGQQVLVTWTNTGNVSGLFNVGGYASASNITGNSYLWTVPNIPTTTGYISVSDANNTCKTDNSDSNFTILPLAPKVTYPNGGEQLNVGQDVNVTWDPSTYYSSTVRIEYSINGGLTWDLISSSYPRASGSMTWTIPHVPLNQAYTQYLVKVSEADNLLRYDVSNATFSTRKPYTLISPNGGQTFYGCSNVNIDGTSNVGTSSSSNNNWRYQYSPDGGSTWSSVTPSALTVPDYAWTLSNAFNSTHMLIRGYNSNYPQYADTSDAQFSILPTNEITVTSPNGGQTFTPGQQVLITWTNTASVSGLFNISGYASASGITGNSFLWTVPNIPGTTAYVSVSDANNTCKSDNNDSNFTILPLAPKVTYPNGGEQLMVGQDVNVAWDPSTYYSSTVRVEYSINGGASWNVISNSYPRASGSMTWTVPHVPLNQAYTQYLVKVSEADNLLRYDVSNATFSSRKPYTLTYPNGGQTFYGCSTVNITGTSAVGTSSSSNNSWRYQYSSDGGTTWLSVTPSALTVPNYSWTLSNALNSTHMLIRGYNTNYPQYADTSDAQFSILPTNEITVTSPNGGQTFTPGQQVLITWTNTASVSGLFNVGGYASASGITGNSFLWTVPNIPSTTAYVSVSDANNTCKSDNSDSNFTILPLAPKVTYPNGGEQLMVGQDVNVAWDPNTYYSSTVRVEYSMNGGASWNLISSSYPRASGSMTWTVPHVPLNQAYTQYLVKVSEADNLLRYDVSNANFSTRKPYTLISPNGGQTFYGCSTVNIDGTSNVGTSSSSNNSWRYQYSSDGGTTWSSVTPSSLTVPDYTWTLSNAFNSTHMLIRGYNTNYPQYADTSDAQFSILPTNDITVTSPNGGQVFTPGQQVLITWTNTGNVSGLFNVGGYASASGITGNSFLWTVPNIPTSTGYVSVSDANNTCKSDNNDSNFTILPLAPKVIYPNGGEQLLVGQDVNVTWDVNTYYSATVRVEYSMNGGASWNVISSSYPRTSGSMTWTIPHVPLNQAYTQYLIKVSEGDNLLRYDVSNANFSTRKPYTLVYPNGGQTINGCSTVNIDGTSNVGTSSSGNNSWRYQYSSDGGSTWSSVTPSSLTVPDYAWSLSNTLNSTHMLIRGYNTNYPQYADTGDTQFSILPSNDITVTYPNGGEVFTPGQQVLVTWTSTANASGLFSIGGYASASGITGNSYLWTVPNAPTGTGYISVSDANNTCKTDNSNGYFSILPAPAKVTAPNGGETIYYGQSFNITWDANTYYSNVRIDFSTDNGISWTPVSTNETNSGIYTWTSRPNIYSPSCLIKVSSTTDLSHYDVSNAVFTIKPAVSILTPNGGENLGGCTVTSLSFERSPVYTTFSLEYSENGGSTWTTISSNFTASGNPSIYNWTLPNNPTNQGLVRVTPTTLGAGFADVGGAVFNVIKPVTIIQPNYGGSLQVGSTYNIKWQSDGISNFYDIFYSVNGGSTWVSIAANYATSTNTYAWTVPNAPSNNCLIRVRDAINTCKEDISDVPFTITGSAPLITVVSPNGQETLTGCSVQNIQWNANASVTSVNVDYSLNGGSTWTSIVGNYTGGSPYSWNVPNITTSLGLVRVVSFSNNTVFDQSDALFTIQKSAVTITHPLTADTTICNGQQIQLSATGGNGTYSWAGSGLNNAGIANPIATPTATTAYVVTSTTGSCSLKDTVTVHVNSNPALLASVSVGSNPGTVLCSNQSVTFTATPTNGGTAPGYQWKKNGSNVGSNSPIYTPATINNNDQVSVTMTSNLACVSGSPVTSPPVTLTVTPTAVPSVNIGVNPGSTVCNGATVQFTANSVNAGSSPVYQWKVNGLNVGGNSATFSSNSLANGDVVTVSLTSSLACATPATVTATGIPMTVTGAPAQPGAISGAASTCTGNTLAYSISPVAGATSYTWTLPAGWSGSSTNNAISATTGSTGGSISVSASNACGSSNSTTLNVSINAAPTTAHAGTDAQVCTTAVNLAANTPVIGTGTWSVIAGSGTLSDTGIPNPIASNLGIGNNAFVWSIQSGGCQASTDTVYIQRFAPPTAADAGTDINLCAGAISASLHGNVPTTGTGQWSLVSGTVGIASATDPNSLLTNLATGIHVLQWTLSNGACASSSDQVAVNVNAAPTLQTNASSNSICPGNSVVLTVSGADTYVWQPGNLTGNNVVVTPAASTIYTVTGTNANGCHSTANVTVTVTNAIPVQLSASDTVVCPGTVVTLQAAGAGTYTWQPGNQTGNTLVVNPTTTTTYSVTGSNAGCSGTASLSIIVQNNPNVAITGTDSICPGQGVTLTATGGSTYLWTPGNSTGSTLHVQPATTTTYTVTASNAGGCSASTTHTLHVLAKPDVNASTNNAGVCAGGSVTLQASGANSYVWSPGNQTTASISVTPAANTTYQVIGSNGFGCKDTAFVPVTVNALPPVAVSAPQTSICQGSNATLTATGANTYVWTPGNLTGNSITVAPTASTVYTVTGTGANGCQNSASLSIQVQSAPNVQASAANTTLCNGTGTTLMANGAGTYTWQPGNLTGASVNITPGSTTQYTVTGTANGCTSSATVTVQVINNTGALTLTANDTGICAGEPVTLSVSGGANYQWLDNNGTGSLHVVNPTATTAYTVTGNTPTGCPASASIVVHVNALPNVTASTANGNICAGGAATLNAFGANTYVWAPGNLTGNSVTVHPTGTTTYQVTGTNANGCSHTATVTVNVTNNPTVGASSPNSTICAGSSTTITANGATSYVWSPGNQNATGINVSPTTTTTYQVIGNSGACADTAFITVQVLSTPNVSIVPSATAVCAGSAVTLTANGANGYVWSPGNQTGGTLVVNPTTTTAYSVQGTSNGCPATATVTITANPQPTVSAGASQTNICQGASTTLSASGPGSMLWNPGNLAGNSVTVSPTGNTTYTVTSTLNGCTNTASVTVSIVAPPALQINSSATQMCPGDSVTLSVTGSGNYTWQPGNLGGNTIVVSPASSTNYTVNGSNANSCNSTASQTVTVHALPVVSFGPIPDACNLNPAFALTQGLPAGGSYEGTGVTGGAFDPGIGNGTYSITYTYTDANGCTGSAPQNVDVYTCMGVEETKTADKAIILYPNPTPDEVYIVSENQPLDRVEVYDSRGALMAIPCTRQDNGNIRFSLIHLSDGAYFVRIYSGNSVTVRKVVKNR